VLQKAQMLAPGQISFSPILRVIFYRGLSHHSARLRESWPSNCWRTFCPESKHRDLLS